MSARHRPFWRRWLLWPTAALLLLNLVALVGVTLPRRSRERLSAERIAALRASVEAQRARTEALRRRAATVKENDADVERFYSEVVCGDDAELLSLLEDLEQQVAEIGVRSSRRGYERNAVKEAPLDRVQVTLPASGSYAQLVALLDRLERSEHFLIVDEVRLQQREQGGALDVVVSTYCRAHPRRPA